MICIKCGANLWISSDSIKCPYCKTLNYPAPKPKFKIKLKTENYQAKRKKYSRQDSTPRIPTPPPIGLGDAIEMVTRTIGIKPCGGCQKRKQTFNEAIPDIRYPWRR